MEFAELIDIYNRMKEVKKVGRSFSRADEALYSKARKVAIRHKLELSGCACHFAREVERIKEFLIRNGAIQEKTLVELFKESNEQD